MSGPVNVLAVMRDATDRLSDAHAAALDEACAAVAELIEADTELQRIREQGGSCDEHENAVRRHNAALARCKGGAK